MRPVNPPRRIRKRQTPSETTPAQSKRQLGAAPAGTLPVSTTAAVGSAPWRGVIGLISLRLCVFDAVS